MSDLISTATSAIQIVTRLRDINKNIANAEFSNALADLAIELAEIKIKVAGLLEENEALRRELERKNALELTFSKYAYFTSDGDGPFCPLCYDSQGKAIRLTKGPYTFGSHICKACKEYFDEA